MEEPTSVAAYVFSAAQSRCGLMNKSSAQLHTFFVGDDIGEDIDDYKSAKRVPQVNKLLGLNPTPNSLFNIQPLEE
jgi:hypothetical protein